jgi:hypothetical protein
MNTQQLLLQLLLGGLLGITGQGIRIIIGLKKQNDEAQIARVALRNLIDANRLRTSVFIGFVAGVLAMLGFAGFTEELSAAAKPLKEIIMGVIAAGYAGTDFIEGFMNRNLPKSNPAPGA